MLDLDALAGAVGLGKTKALATSYRETFAGEDGQRVLGDLANFCAVNSTTVQASDRESFVMEGRRQAFLRIAAWLELDWRDFDELERDLFDHDR